MFDDEYLDELVSSGEQLPEAFQGSESGESFVGDPVFDGYKVIDQE